jgi:GNAT superfamily N-acetyltransferase
MEITIRAAQPDDIPRMCDLLGDLFSVEADFEVDVAKQVKGLSMLVGDPSGRVFVGVAVVDDCIAGMAMVQTLVSTAEGGRVGFVEDVIVDKRFRCRNVGTLLIERIIAWSREQGLARLQLLADRENHPALNFYTSRGWNFTKLNCLRKYPYYPQKPTVD